MEIQIKITYLLVQEKWKIIVNNINVSKYTLFDYV